MLIVSYVIITKESNEVWIISLVNVKIEFAAALTTFLHSKINEVFKQGSLIIT